MWYHFQSQVFWLYNSIVFIIVRTKVNIGKPLYQHLYYIFTQK